MTATDTIDFEAVDAPPTLADRKVERDRLNAQLNRLVQLRSAKQDELRATEETLDAGFTNGASEERLVELAIQVVMHETWIKSLTRAMEPISLQHRNASLAYEQADTRERQREQGQWEHKKALELMASPRCDAARKDAEATARTGGRAQDAERLGQRAAYELAKYLLDEAERMHVDVSTLANRT